MKDYQPSRSTVAADKQIQPIEREMCRRDRMRFLMRWVYTINEIAPGEKTIARLPYKEYIERFVEVWKEPLLLIPKSRRMMITWLEVAMCVHMFLFEPHRLIFFQGKREDDASELVNRAKHIVTMLPKFMRPKTTSKHCLLKNEDNGSRIWGIPKGPDIIRMHTASMIFIDEGGFIDELRSTLMGAKPCIEGGGKLHIVSTLTASYFADLMDDIEEE